MDSLQKNGDSCYFWGGIGKPKNRPFLEVILRMENETNYRLQNLITWAKKRGIGAKYNYLFTREELTFCVKGKDNPNVFNIPHLEDKAACRPFNPKYKCLSEYKRRTNIWSDVSDIFPHKYHACEKPTALYEIPILTSSNPGDLVLDPFAGSGTLAVAAIKNQRRFICIEKDPDIYNIAINRLDLI